MSCQRGNISRVRPQKYQNITAFKNTLHDTNKRTLIINAKEIAEVCKKCQEIIAWKVKYKKYKLLSQPKTCNRCHKKNIKESYHTVCLECAKSLEICCKCGKKEEIVAHFSPSETERLHGLALLQQEVKALSERKRRAYYRHIDKLDGKKKRKKRQKMKESVYSQEEGVGEAASQEEEAEPEPSLSVEEYLTSARSKLEELKKGMDEDFLDDLEDLGISTEDEEWEDVDS